MRLLLLALLCACTSLLHAQNNPDYELLWQIKHKNNNKISYLFGTAHLKDARVFNFSDAVLPAIKNSETFALEFHPDSSLADLIERTKGKALKQYEKDLTRTERQKLNDRFKKKTGDTISNIEELSIKDIELILTPDGSKNNDRETFLDAYLYGVARFQNKTIYGLETAASQMSGLLENDEDNIEKLDLIINDDSYVDYKIERVEELIKYYETGNLSQIYRFVGSGLDEDMTSRNTMMVSSMEAIMKDQTLFAAIGAAHLLGKNGVINMLRLKGYEVTVVPATFKNGGARELELDGTKLWTTFEKPEMGYRLKMPPNLSNGVSEDEDFYMSHDLISGIATYHGARDVSEYGSGYWDNLLEGMRARYKMATNFRENLQVVDGDSIYTFKGNIADKEILMNLRMRSEYIYLFGVEHNKHSKSIAAANYYLDNIEIFEPQIPAVTWEKLIDEVGGYEIDFPAEYSDMSRVIKSEEYFESVPYSIKLLRAIDRENKLQYLVRYNDFPVGYYLQDLDVTIEEYKQSIIGRNAQVLYAKDIVVNGMRGEEIHLKLADRFYGMVRMFFRGNRLYMLLMSSIEPDLENVTVDHPFFNSFKTRALIEPEFQKITTNDGAFSINFPVVNERETEALFEPTSYDSVESIVGLDANSGDSYVLASYKLGDYFYAKNADELIEEQFESLLEENDSVAISRPFSKNGLTGIEKIYTSSKNVVTKTFRLAVHNGYVIYAGAIVDQTRTENETQERFFNSLTPNKSKPFAINTDKAKLIFKDLKSKDSTTYKKALSGLGNYNFTMAHKKDLLKIASKKHAIDSLENAQRNYAISALGNLKNDAIVPDLEKLYNARNIKDNQRIEILRALNYTKTATAASSYFKLLKEKFPQSDHYYDVILPYHTDSVITLKKYEDQVWQLYQNKATQDDVMSYISRQIHADSTSVSFVENYKKQFATDLKNNVSKYIDSTDVNDTYTAELSIHNYFNVLRRVKNDDLNLVQLAEKIATHKTASDYVKHAGFEYYIEHANALDVAFIHNYMEPLVYRYEAMELLIKNNYAHLIPQEYLEPQNFAQLAAYFQLYEYDETYGLKMDLLGDININDNVYKCYSFYYDYEDEDEVEQTTKSDVENDTNEEEVEKYLIMVKMGEIDLAHLKLLDSYITYEIITETDWKEIAKKYAQDIKE